MELENTILIFLLGIYYYIIKSCQKFIQFTENELYSGVYCESFMT